MFQPPPPPPKNKIRNIVIAVVVIAVILIGSFTALIVLNPSASLFTPFDFSVSTSDSSGYVIQGNSIQTIVYVNKISGNGQVTLSADSGSSGIQCSFSPSTSSPDFSSTLTMTVPSYTSTNPYSVTITATSGGTTHSTAYTVSVLSAKVSVSGTVTTTGIGTSPSRIDFVDTQTGLTYTASMSGSYYTISLDNQHTYSVTVYWTGLLWSDGSFSGGNLYVNAPVGYTSMSQDYSG